MQHKKNELVYEFSNSFEPVARFLEVRHLHLILQILQTNIALEYGTVNSAALK